MQFHQELKDIISYCRMNVCSNAIVHLLFIHETVYRLEIIF